MAGEVVCGISDGRHDFVFQCNSGYLSVGDIIKTDDGRQKSLVKGNNGYYYWKEVEMTTNLEENLTKTLGLDQQLSVKQAESVADKLRKLGDLHVAKNKEYGNTYKAVGGIVFAMTGEVKLSSAEDFERMGNLFQMAGKLCRYGKNFKNGGHGDSCDDLSIYAQMQNELDRIAKEKKGNGND